MSITIRGTSSENILGIENALQIYERQHPGSRIEMYLQNSISVRIRVIDPAFTGLEKSARHAMIWEFLEKANEEYQSDISMIVLLAPGEESRSMANLEFEDPSPSLIQ